MSSVPAWVKKWYEENFDNFSLPKLNQTINPATGQPPHVGFPTFSSFSGFRKDEDHIVDFNRAFYSNADLSRRKGQWPSKADDTSTIDADYSFRSRRKIVIIAVVLVVILLAAIAAAVTVTLLTGKPE
ncbi:hypothetical protein BaRGS_00039836 [Batillaria attramentaria]|uniref:Uncharacterized protein n=1 Tax=Batillaria attramentaria TaxID=370345 RepID=A0ABD0J2W3_9CAEN